MAKIFKKLLIFIFIIIFSGVFACTKSKTPTASLSKQTLSSPSEQNNSNSANNSSNINNSLPTTMPITNQTTSTTNTSKELIVNTTSSTNEQTISKITSINTQPSTQSSMITSISSANTSSFSSSSIKQSNNSSFSSTNSSSNSSNAGEEQEPEEPIIMTNQTETYAEMWRPQYHYSAKQSWVNDPNGLVYYKGVWHKYYQTNPNVNVFGNIHWGHATSTDLVNWTEHNPVLAPDNVGLMFSGTAVVDHNNTSGFFTNTADKKGIVVAYSTDTQHIGIAYSLDDGYTFTKVSSTNPVVKNPNEEHFRDPHIFWYEEGQEWIMVIAGGFVRYYASKNLVDWTYRSTSNIWTECPNLIKFKVEGTNYYKWLLYCGGRGYYVGTFNGTTFTPETDYIAIDGPDNYAGIMYANVPDNRIVMTSWLNSWNYTAPEGKWNGCFALPVDLKLVKTANSYRLIKTPVQELNQIKGESLFSATNQTYTNVNALQCVKSNSFELNAEIDVNNSSNFTLSFCLGDGDATTLEYNKATSKITFNRTQSKYGFNALKEKGIYSFNVDGSSNVNGIMRLRLFVDVSNIELYINDGYHYFVARIQPFSSSQDMKLIGDKVVVKSLAVNKCKPTLLKDDVSAIHVGDSSTIFALINGAEVVRDVYVLGNGIPTITVADPTKVSATLTNGKLKVKALTSGVTSIRISSGKYYKDLEVLAYTEGESYFNNQIGDLTITGGSIKVSPLDMEITSSGGDAVAFSNTYAKNLEYSADIRLQDVGAGALLIRAKDSNSFYSINIDINAKIVKFWKKVNGQVSDIASKQVDINAGEFYNLKVLAKGANIKVYLNNQIVIDATDYFLTEGKLGLNVFQSKARFNNIKYSVISTQESNIDAIGTNTKTNASVVIENGIIDLNNLSNDNAFVVGSVEAGNFAISGDIALGGQGAGAFVFRYLDVNNFYCINIDNEFNVVKFWKKVNGNSYVVAQVPTNINQGTFYNLKIVANGVSIKAYLNTVLVIDTTDGDLTSGKVGLNTWLIDCYFKNVIVEQGTGYAYFGNITCQNAAISQNNGVFAVDNIAGGDAFAIGNVEASNFTLSADFNLAGVGAGSFVLRYLDANNFYCVNIDSEFNVVKFWKKVNGTATIVAQYSATINANADYNLKVELSGSQIKVYLNNNLAINSTDTSLTSGKMGLNSWITDFTIKNLYYKI